MLPILLACLLASFTKLSVATKHEFSFEIHEDFEYVYYKSKHLTVQFTSMPEGATEANFTYSWEIVNYPKAAMWDEMLLKPQTEKSADYDIFVTGHYMWKVTVCINGGECVTHYITDSFLWHPEVIVTTSFGNATGFTA